MTTVPVPVPPVPSPATLTTDQFQTLFEIPPELEWFANLTNANTRRAYQQDIKDFQAYAGVHRPEQFREMTRAHVIAWRQQLVNQQLANDTIRRKLAALSSLYAYLCERHAVLHNPVLGVKRPRSMNREGVTPALGDHQARMLLQAPSGGDAQRPARPRDSRDAALSRVTLQGIMHANRRGHPAAGRGAASARGREGG